jgi:hypothetical protein
MDFYVLSYRMWRLRRLIGIAVAVPSVLVLFLSLFGGGLVLLLLPLTIALPVVHALRYPGEWIETMVVSGVMATTILLVSILMLFFGPGGDTVLILAGITAASVAAFYLSMMLPEMFNDGPVDRLTRSFTARTNLPLDKVRASILLRPGHEDSRVICSDADREGFFTVTHRRAQIEHMGEIIVTEPVQFRARLVEDTARVHEVRGVNEQGMELSVLRTSFREAPASTVITVEELTGPMTMPNAAGLWLTDSLADYVTDELDRAAGLRMRAFRCLPADSAVEELKRRYQAFVNRSGRRAAT